MSRRFIPGQNKMPAPSTPQAQRVLPTPPATETPAFRLAPAGNAVDSSLQRVDTRPGTAQAKQQPGAAPKLNIGRFTQNKGQKNHVLATDNRATRSPARPSKPFSRANEDQTVRPTSIFGRQNGLLPSLTRHSPPMSPGLMGPPAQPTNSRFSSPVSTIAGDDTIDNSRDKSQDEIEVDLNDQDAHTSGSNVFGQAHVAVANHPAHLQHRGFPPHSINEYEGTLEDSFEEQEIDSPSPVAVSKRRAEDHNDHEETHYPPQAQAQPEPPAPTGPKTLFSSSLDAYIETHNTEWIAAKKRWEDCTMDEWKNGPTELIAEFGQVMDRVKDFMMQVFGSVSKRMEVYAGINKDVDTHKLRLDSRDAMLTQEKERLVKHAGGLEGSFVAN